MRRPHPPAYRCADREFRKPRGRRQDRSIPFERSFLPLIDKADGEDRKEYDHRPKAEQSQRLEGDRPGKQKRDFEVEDDEQDGNEIKSYVELHPRIVEGVEAALIGRELLGIGLLVGDHERGDQQREPDHQRDSDEDHQRKIILQERIHHCLAFDFCGATPREPPRPRNAIGSSQTRRWRTRDSFRGGSDGGLAQCTQGWQASLGNQGESRATTRLEPELAVPLPPLRRQTPQYLATTQYLYRESPDLLREPGFIERAPAKPPRRRGSLPPAGADTPTEGCAKLRAARVCVVDLDQSARARWVLYLSLRSGPCRFTALASRPFPT